jgi:hypothetical protein
MKLSDDGFNARRLRPRGPNRWRMRIGAALAAVLAAFGILLGMAGIASLLGRPPAIDSLDTSPTGAAILTVFGVLFLYLGVFVWRRCRRRMRRTQDLNLAPHLMKKHD